MGIAIPPQLTAKYVDLVEGMDLTHLKVRQDIPPMIMIRS